MGIKASPTCVLSFGDEGEGSVGYLVGEEHDEVVTFDPRVGSDLRLELLDGLTKRGQVVGVDLVEVAPDYDHGGSTSTLAAQLLLNLIGRVLHNRVAA